MTEWNDADKILPNHTNDVMLVVGQFFYPPFLCIGRYVPELGWLIVYRQINASSEYKQLEKGNARCWAEMIDFPGAVKV